MKAHAQVLVIYKLVLPMIQVSPENDSWALFLRNYLLETDDIVALDTKGVRFHYFMSALSALTSPVLVLTVVLSCLKQAVWKRLSSSFPFYFILFKKSFFTHSHM